MGHLVIDLDGMDTAYVSVIAHDSLGFGYGYARRLVSAETAAAVLELIQRREGVG